MAKSALVIGSGPAGLMAADTLAESGLRVTIAEAMPSPGRKFLMAGKSGLNITKNEPIEQFKDAYFEASSILGPALQSFGPVAVQGWARALGQDIFTGSSGHVFPTRMKASPLLRAWLARLTEQKVTLQRNWVWTGFAPQDQIAFNFETPSGPKTVSPDVAILALGGASWARLGSDGKWAAPLSEIGVELSPFQPSNMGFRVKWTDHMRPFFGQPVKQVRLKAGRNEGLGEFVISSQGLEGSGIYAVSRSLRDGAPFEIDLMPDLSIDQAVARLTKARKGATVTERLRKHLRLNSIKRALAREFANPLPREDRALAVLLKTLPVRHDGPYPMDQAISTAGGVSFEALNEGLMLKALPGVFCAGEMIDWEAPTGGYLITACLATGRHAAQSAIEWISARAPSHRTTQTEGR